MNILNEDYIPFGQEWEKEMNKLPKNILINMIRESNKKNQSLSDIYREENHYSSVELLTSLQKELGYNERELSTVAVLGLVGEAGEVLNEVSFMGDQDNTHKALEYIEKTTVPVSGHLLFTAIKICRDIETFKKAIRSGELEIVCYWDNKESFIGELADTIYYANILAMNAGLTLFDLCQMAHDKIRRKQADGGSSEDRKS